MPALELETETTHRAPALSGHPASVIKATSLCALVLAVCASFVDWNTLFVNGLQMTLNDQVGYVSVARNVAESNGLQSNVIFPSLLTQETTRNSLYMPGHYLALAATYKLLGFSIAHSFLPSLFAFVVASFMIFLIAAKLYGANVGYYSCILFACFPMNLIYSFTAMAEMTLVAAALVAFAIFIFMPVRLKLWLGPLLVALPMLFRETGAVIALPMALLVRKDAEHKTKSTALFCALAILVVMLLLTSPAASGRPSLLQANIFAESFEAVYSNAFSLHQFHPDTFDWMVAIGKKLNGNFHDLCTPHFANGIPSAGEFFSFLFILSGIPLALVLWRRKHDHFALGVAAMLAFILLFLLGFYTVWVYRGIRILLIAQPFVAMLWGLALTEALKPIRLRRRIGDIAMLLLVVYGTSATYQVFRTERGINRQTAQDTAFLESLGHDDRGLLVSPYWLSLDYVQKHHPVRWSFVPSNVQTLKLLDERYSISTVILPLTGPHLEEGKLRPSDLRGIGLVQEAEVSHRDVKFLIFKRHTRHSDVAHVLQTPQVLLFGNSAY